MNKFPEIDRVLIVEGRGLNNEESDKKEKANVSREKTCFSGINQNTGKYETFEFRTTTTDGNGLITEIRNSQHGFTTKYEYDGLYRLATKELYVYKYPSSYSLKRIFAYGYETIGNSRETTRVSYEALTNGRTLYDKYVYEYYRNGNLKTVKHDNSKVVEYKYDSYNRLVREDNYALGYSQVFEYDNYGNITKRIRYAITGETIGTTAIKTDTYTYGNAKWKEQLTSYNGSAIKYDASGNPLNYRGKTLQWHGRKLINASGVAMEYDYNGLRVRKGGRIYYWQGNKLKAERWVVKENEEEKENYIYYFYDESGVSGMSYNGTDYFYRKNIFGDVITVYDSNGHEVCKYTYDAWGNCTISGDTTLGNINPIRYRGYYWDKESGFYYLQTRYYDPELGRFISPDDVSYLDPESLFGLNLYAYCGNNPVMYADPTGQSIISILLAFAGLLLSGTISGVIAAAEREGDETFWGAFTGGFIEGVIGATAIAAGLAIGGVLGFIVTAGMSFLGGYVGNMASQQISYGKVDRRIAAIQGTISAFTNSISYLGLSFMGITSGITLKERFINALSFSEIGVGVSIFIVGLALPSGNSFRGKLN